MPPVCCQLQECKDQFPESDLLWKLQMFDPVQALQLEAAVVDQHRTWLQEIIDKLPSAQKFGSFVLLCGLLNFIMCYVFCIVTIMYCGVQTNIRALLSMTNSRE